MTVQCSRVAVAACFKAPNQPPQPADCQCYATGIMGVNASILISPIDPVEPTWFARKFRGAKSRPRPERPLQTRNLRETATRLFEVFHEHEFLKPGADPCFRLGPTFATWDWFSDSPVSPEWAHPKIQAERIEIPAENVLQKIEAVVPATTNAEAWSGLTLPGDIEPDDLRFPTIDIFVLSEPLPVVDGVWDRISCSPWALVEFGFEDVRYSEEFHRVRDSSHAVFEDLRETFGCEPQVSLHCG